MSVVETVIRKARLRNLRTPRVDVVGRGAVRDPEDGSQPAFFSAFKDEDGGPNEDCFCGCEVDDSEDVNKSEPELIAKALSAAARNALPDSDFGYIEPGPKGPDGKTLAKNRHYPLNDKEHVRLATQMRNSPHFAKAKTKIAAAAARYGIEMSKDEDVAGKTSLSKVGDDSHMPDTETTTETSETTSTAPQAVAEKVDKSELVELQKAEIESLKERLTATEAVAKGEKDAREAREWLSKAETEFSRIPGASLLEKADTLREIQGSVKPETFDKLSAMLRASDESFRLSNIYDPKGVNGADAPGSPLGKIEARVVELQKAEPGLTPEKAFSKATAELPEIYEEYRRSVRDARG